MRIASLQLRSACNQRADRVVSVWTKYFSTGLDAVAAGKYEVELSQNAVDACVKAGIKHIVYSTLDDLPAEITCEHLASKAKGKCLSTCSLNFHIS